jgi:hypothetical protein
MVLRNVLLRGRLGTITTHTLRQDLIQFGCHLLVPFVSARSCAVSWFGASLLAIHDALVSVFGLQQGMVYMSSREAAVTSWCLAVPVIQYLYPMAVLVTLLRSLYMCSILVVWLLVDFFQILEAPVLSLRWFTRHGMYQACIGHVCLMGGQVRVAQG